MVSRNSSLEQCTQKESACTLHFEEHPHLSPVSFWISKLALASQPPTQRKAYWDSLHQQIQCKSFPRVSVHFKHAALHQPIAYDLMQLAAGISPALGPLKTSQQGSCSYTSNYRTRTTLTSFPLNPDNYSASFNTPREWGKTQVSAISYYKVSGECMQCTSRNEKNPKHHSSICRLFPAWIGLTWASASSCGFSPYWREFKRSRIFPTHRYNQTRHVTSTAYLSLIA